MATFEHVPPEEDVTSEEIPDPPRQIGDGQTTAFGERRVSNPPLVILNDMDDPEEYMQLVPYRKTPVIQISLAFLAMMFGIIALVYDELSDGDVELYNEWLSSDINEVDYDCGWQSFIITNDYGSGKEQSEKIYYKKESCSDAFDDYFNDWCKDMEKHGQVWLVTEIIAVVLCAHAIAAVYRQGKESVSYFVSLLLALILFLTGVLNWNFNERCSDFEDFSSESATLETKIGVSSGLIYGSVGSVVLGLLLSSIHIYDVKKRRRAERQMAEMTSVQ